MERRQFSGGMQGKNLRYVKDMPSQHGPLVRTGFVLLEHFSLPAFTQALDTIITANLLRAGLFSSHTYGLNDGEVVSDLGLVEIAARTDGILRPGVSALTTGLGQIFQMAFERDFNSCSDPILGAFVTVDVFIGKDVSKHSSSLI